MTTQRGYQICEINITPLTDIFLVLLVIMMVVTPMVDFAGLNMAVLSVGNVSDPSVKPKTLLLQINAKGEYAIGEQIVQPVSLAEVLREKAPENPDGVLIETDPEAPHEAMARAMAAVTSAGITKLAVGPKEEPPEAAKPEGKTKNKKK